jgi:hypothetical protein
MFGWLGFNSGNALPELHGHAFFNTMIGACTGAIAAWMLSKAGQLKRWKHEIIGIESKQIGSNAVLEGLEVGPRFVIGMMGGLVAVTANGGLPGVTWWMAASESFAGGLVAVLISTWMSARSRPGEIDDPLGVIGTHGCAAVVGIMSTALWLASDAKSFLLRFAVQLIGCGVCIVVGWLFAMAPCFILLTSERQALTKTTGSWLAAKFRLRLGAIEQLGTPREPPDDVEWNDRIHEATHRILSQARGDDKWWEAVEIYATAEVLDKSAQVAIAQQIVEKLPDTVGSPKNERLALVTLSSATQYARPDDISRTLDICLTRARRNGNGHCVEEAWGRRELLMWSTALLTERTAVLGKGARPDLLPRAHEGLNFLREVLISDENPWVRDLAQVGIINANARLFSVSGSQARLSQEVPPNGEGAFVERPFDSEGRWLTAYALVTNRAALPMLLFLADRRWATIAETAEEFNRTNEDTSLTVEVLLEHYLISRNADKLRITDGGLDMVEQLRQAVE